VLRAVGRLGVAGVRAIGETGPVNPVQVHDLALVDLDRDLDPESLPGAPAGLPPEAHEVLRRDSAQPLGQVDVPLPRREAGIHGVVLELDRCGVLDDDWLVGSGQAGPDRTARDAGRERVSDEQRYERRYRNRPASETPPRSGLLHLRNLKASR
jgi:hypothetical protein